MTPPRSALTKLLLSAWLIGLTGCASGPSYFGGPSAEEAHGIVFPGQDITIWKVDGRPTTSHSFNLLVAPGPRILRLRIEHSIESESPTPFEYQDMSLRVEEGYYYHLERKPGTFPPYEVLVRKQPLR